VEQGVAEPATGFEDLGEKCEAILHRGLPERRRQQVEKYLAHNFAYQDNQTLERIVDLVAESLSARCNAHQLAAPFSPSMEASFACSIILPVDDEDLFALAVTLNSIAERIPGERFELVIIDCSTRQETKELLSALTGDIKILHGEPGWSYAYACNQGAREARGKHLAFLKPGLVVEKGWLEGLLETAENEVDVGAVGGVTLNENGLIWHMGIAFDVNQAPFSIYRLLPVEFSGARRRRDFKALEIPFLTGRELFCRLGGFSVAFANRFEDIDFCLHMQRATGLRVIYNPTSIVIRQHVTWRAIDSQEQCNRIRFFSKWTGYVWQDDESYLQEDGLTHDALSAIYRELAGRIAYGGHLAANSLTMNL
jgi:GT2 family glycosyltransferase